MRESIAIRCPPESRADALQLLMAARDAEQQEGLALAIAAAEASGSAAWEGLFVVGAGSPSGALWVQPAAGNTAVVWPPPSGNPAADALFQAAAAFVDQRRIGVAQFIAAESDGFEATAMSRRGFSRLAELVYLFADVSREPEQKSQPPQSLRFMPRAGDDRALLAQVIEETYVDSRDCPELDNVRPVADVLAGYRAQGDYDPEHWYLVAENGHNVGVLLLTAHPNLGNWELVYMGVIPTARGRRLGEAIARFACTTARHCGAQRLVLAVDASNQPALEMYRRAGFHAWERRTVYARLTAASARFHGN